MPTLSDFFASRDAVVIRGRPVTFRAVRRTVRADDDNAETYAVDVRALLFFVDESERAAAYRDADNSVNATLKPGESAPDGAREDARALYVLFRAIRNTDAPHVPLFRTIDELKGCLVRPAFLDLWSEYCRFEQEEFPPYVDPDEFVKLVEAAKTQSFLALREGRDLSLLRRSLPSLANLLWT